MRRVKIKNKDIVCTLKCEISIKFRICQSWKFSAGAGVFVAGVGGGKKPEFAEH
jgi:putative transposon-encoded protein